MRKSSAAAALALALAVGLPPLGQQAALQLAPGGITQVRRPPKRRRPTQHDIDRLDAAERKRQRRAGIRLANWLWGNARRHPIARAAARR